MNLDDIRVLHFICSAGFYGAEKWIVALLKNIDDGAGVNSQLAITDEGEASDTSLQMALEGFGFCVHSLPMRGRFDPSIIYRLVKTIKENQIGVVHTHGYKSDIIGLLAAKIAGVRCISTPHGFENTTDIKLKLYIGLGCRVLRFFDRVVPLSKDLLAVIKGYGVAEKNQRYIGNGVDLTEIEYRKPSLRESGLVHTELGLSADARVVGFIGQMIDRKNLIALLNTYDCIAGQVEAAHLVLIGDGADRSQYEAHAQSLAHADQIHFLGYRSDALCLLAEFDMFLMTSSLEGVPRCLMEAMAVGVPIASFSIPGVDQLIIDGKTGFLAEYGRNEKLASRCVEILADGDLADAIAQNAVDYVQRNFSAQTMAREYSDLYRELVYS